MPKRWLNLTQCYHHACTTYARALCDLLAAKRTCLYGIETWGNAGLTLVWQDSSQQVPRLGQKYLSQASTYFCLTEPGSLAGDHWLDSVILL